MHKKHVVLLALASVLGVGCGRRERRITVAPGGTQVKVQTSQGTATITAGQADISGLPPQLRYPGATLVSTTEVQTPEGAGKAYVLETTDSKQAVVQFYKNAMPDWGNKVTTEGSESTVIMAAASDGSQGMNVGVTAERGKTQVTVVYWHNR
ncbi:MAG: hypothetical protein ABIK43_04525 [candidate division WOR-3 bacterium]